MRLWKAVCLLAVLILGIVPLLIACDEQSTTTASCAFVVGNGANGTDTKLHKIIYPGQVVSNVVNETLSYVPCNSRNYIINNGSIKNANGDVVGDRAQLIQANTKNGVPITIAVTALWTLNQDPKALAEFYNVCFKYHCANDKDQSGTANFSTPGWNGMLAENFGPTLDTLGKIGAKDADDSIWQTHDPDQYTKLATAMSEHFADIMRANLGYPDDLFCGSGNSVWSDVNNPGVGKFTCNPVRFRVDDVQRGAISADDSNAGVAAINQQRLKNAQALYGDEAGYWLGLQDTIDKCKQAGSTCIINIGGSGGGASVPVSVPNASPTPVPQPTPTPKK